MNLISKSFDVAVTPRRLLKEIKKCVAANNQGNAEAIKLNAAEQWVIREQAVADATKRLSQAANDFFRAAANAGIDSYAIEALFSAATSKDLTAVSKRS